MKTIHLSTFDKGGAGVGAYRLHEAFNREGKVQSQLMYLHSSAPERFQNVHVAANSFLSQKIALARLAWEKIWFASKVKDKDDRFRFSTATTGLDLSNNVLMKEADVIHLHWINNGFLSVETIGELKKLNKPIVWTLYDMWAMTGGCHHSRECENFQQNCGNCFYLSNPSDNDVSSKVHKRKVEAFNELDFTLIPSSNWLGNRARQSSLFKNAKIVVMPTPLNIEVYKPNDKGEAKASFSLPKEKVCISFVAANVGNLRKGFEYLRKALWVIKEKQPEWANKVRLLVMGEEKTDIDLELPFEATFTGYLNDEEKIINFYNASDVFVLPSLEENLPNTIMEALTCGVPSVAFEVGGIPDLIEPKVNGDLAKYMDVEDLALKIIETLDTCLNSTKYQENARRKGVDNFRYDIITEKVNNLYIEAVKK